MTVVTIESTILPWYGCPTVFFNNEDRLIVATTSVVFSDSKVGFFIYPRGDTSTWTPWYISVPFYSLSHTLSTSLLSLRYNVYWNKYEFVQYILTSKMGHQIFLIHTWMVSNIIPLASLVAIVSKLVVLYKIRNSSYEL